MTAPAEPIGAPAIELAARAVERTETRVARSAAVLVVVAAAAMATIGLAGIPAGFTAFILAGRAAGRRRRARAVAIATADASLEWTLAGRTVTAHDARGPREDLELELPAGTVRSLRALPPARAIIGRGQVTSSTPPDTER